MLTFAARRHLRRMRSGIFQKILLGEGSATFQVKRAVRVFQFLRQHMPADRGPGLEGDAFGGKEPKLCPDREVLSGLTGHKPLIPVFAAVSGVPKAEILQVACGGRRLQGIDQRLLDSCERSLTVRRPIK